MVQGSLVDTYHLYLGVVLHPPQVLKNQEVENTVLDKGICLTLDLDVKQDHISWQITYLYQGLSRHPLWFPFTYLRMQVVVIVPTIINSSVTRNSLSTQHHMNVPFIQFHSSSMTQVTHSQENKWRCFSEVNYFSVPVLKLQSLK